jgi:hypothetical protein
MNPGNRAACSAAFIAVALLLCSSRAAAQDLFLTGLPCPGGAGEPTNSHPLIWVCHSAADTATAPSRGWEESAPIRYGDFLAVTWFNQCRTHGSTWPFAQLALVVTNATGGFQTNTSVISMPAGYNFSLVCLYWYTNNGALVPTNFTLAQAAVEIGQNQTPVLNSPPALLGTNIAPPIYLGFTNPVTETVNLPGIASLAPWLTNGDGALIINPALQLPFWVQQSLNSSNAGLVLHGLPGRYTLQTSTALSQSWSNQAEVVAAPDGTGHASLALADGPTLFLRASGLNPALGLGYNAEFQTDGSAFEAAVYCNSTPQSFLWTWSDGSTSTAQPIASKDFGTDGSRRQRLAVLPPDAVSIINLGFYGSDGGEALPLTNRPPQGVESVSFPYPLASLRYWASSYNPITNKLDFTGFSSLEDVECFHCTNLEQVAVANLPSIKRVCFEACSLRELDLSHDPNLEDVRAALNSFTGIRIGGGTGPKIWHWCVRDNPQLTQDFNQLMTNFFSLRELWIWNANQGGALTVASTNFTDIELQANHYEYADFTGQSKMDILWIFDNALTNLVLNGCTSLQDLQAARNQLPQAALDSILAFLDSSAPGLQSLDLTGNAGLPSPAGYAHYTNLINRGVIAFVDFPGNGFPYVALDSTALLAETCLPANHAVDPGESVTLALALKNIGALDTTNLTVTLLQTNGIAPASTSQNYGALLAGGPAATNAFSFTADGPCGSTVFAAFQLYDGSNDLGLVFAPIKLGADTSLWTEGFDSVAAPALPSDWSSDSLTNAPTWVTVDVGGAAGPNVAFCPDADTPDMKDLISPPILLPAGPAQLSFQNSYGLEPGEPGTANDGAVLEIKIGSNPFTDILAAGGNFTSGGYVAVITDLWGNPLPGRHAWTGNSGGPITTRLDLPAAAQGQTIQLRWRCATDDGNGTATFNGWHIDSIAIITSACCTTLQPSLSPPLKGRKSG